MVSHTSILYHTGMLTLHSLSRSDTKGIKDHINMHGTRYENKKYIFKVECSLKSRTTGLGGCS